MKTHKLLVSVLMLVGVLFSACAPTATPAVPPRQTPTTVPTAGNTAAPPAAKVIAEWRTSMPQAFAFGFDSVWVPSHRSPEQTIRIDPNSNQEIAVIQNTGALANSVLVAGDSVWVDGVNDDMAKINPKTNMIVAKVAGTHTMLAYGFDSVWSTTRHDGLDRIDPATAQIIASIQLGNDNVDYNNGVMVTTSAVWVDQRDEGELIKIDPATNSIVSKTLYSQLIDQARTQTKLPTGKATDYIWLPKQDPADPQGCGLLQIDPNTGAGLSFPYVGADCNPPAVTDNAVWLSGTSQIDRFNLTTNQIDATYKLEPGISNLGIGFGSIWVMSEAFDSVQRLDVAP